MNSGHPNITIGFITRERCSLAVKSLQSLYKNTTIPFRLLIVDGLIPERYRRKISDVVRDKPNVTYIRRDRFLYPNEAKNLVFENTQDEYICFLENDCLVSEGWLANLINACEAFPAMVASPILFEGPMKRNKIHHAWKLGSILKEPGAEKDKIKLTPHRGTPSSWLTKTDPFKVDFIEGHCVLYHREALKNIYPLKPDLNIDEFVDNALTFHKLGITSIMVPSASVEFYAPKFVAKEELPYFRFRWDVNTAEHGRNYLAGKWHIENMGNPVSFCVDRLTNHVSPKAFLQNCVMKHWKNRLTGYFTTN